MHLEGKSRTSAPWLLTLAGSKLWSGNRSWRASCYGWCANVQINLTTWVPFLLLFWRVGGAWVDQTEAGLCVEASINYAPIRGERRNICYVRYRT
jgi:hypothetical protein